MDTKLQSIINKLNEQVALSNREFVIEQNKSDIEFADECHLYIINKDTPGLLRDSIASRPYFHMLNLISIIIKSVEIGKLTMANEIQTLMVPKE